MMQLFDLTGKTALVTGCSRGIGQSMALGLAEAGADIIGVSASLKAGDSDTEKAVKALGRAFYPYSCDFSDRSSLYAFIEAVRKDGHSVNILVNNAGTIFRSPVTDYPDDQWDRILEVNLNAPFILSREFGRDMAAAGGGKIIFTASLLSFQGGITVPAYAASKGAVAQLTKALSNELAAKNVQINAIAPGYIATDNTEALQKDPQRSKAILERIPAGRWGSPDDFKGVTVFLASKASDYMNGSIVTVDGGWMGR